MLSFSYIAIGILIASGMAQAIGFAINPERKSLLLMACISVIAAIYLYVSLQIHFLGNTSDGLRRWPVNLYLIEMILLSWVIFIENKKSFKGLFGSSIVLACAALLLNSFTPNGIIFEGISSITEKTLFNGEIYYVINGENTWYFGLLSLAFYLSFLTYLIANLVQSVKMKTKKSTVTFSVFILLFLFINIFDVLVDLGSVNFMYLSEYGMLPLIFILYVNVAAEIKEKNEIERRFDSLQSNFQLLINKVNLIVVGLDKQGAIEFANPFFLELSGYSENEIIGKDYMSTFIPERFRNVLNEKFEEILSGQSLDLYENPILNKEGKELEIAWSNVIIRDQNGEFERVISVGANITERKRKQVELEMAYDQISAIKKRLEEENTFLKDNFHFQVESHSAIIGDSDAILYVKSAINDVATLDSTVLVEGETGVGKELVAEAVHQASNRKNGPFIKVNCGALPKDLIESELFGHERGAFTGANASRKGRFELADGGTIFLDEIGEMPLELQPKLLRVLQTGGYSKVGGEKVVHADVRVIAATNRNLQKEVDQGNFREDLYYRLSVFPITVPPLRDRIEDLEILLIHFLEEFSKKCEKPIPDVSMAVMKKLRAYSWPGNIRELRNVLERAIITSKNNKLILDRNFGQKRPKVDSKIIPLEENEKEYLIRVLEHFNWKVSGKNSAAEALQINEATLRSKLKKLGLKKPVQ